MLGCCKTLKPVVLELGGKDPFVVCDDADIDRVMPFVMKGSFFNAGQNCIGVERVYVYEKVRGLTSFFLLLHSSSYENASEANVSLRELLQILSRLRW